MSWETVKLGNISSNIQTGPFGSQLHKSDYSELGTPVIMPKDLLNGHVSENSIARVSQTHVDRLSRHQIEIGDIIYSRRGDVGRCALATEKEKGWLCGTGCLRVTVNLDFANPKFVFYQLQKAETIGWVEKHAVGATMLNLNTSILSDIPIELPELETQNKIVETLSNYDNLIENNQKQIKLLEEAAQRLYKEWFVDFRFPGHEHTPIVDGVPEGWKKESILNNDIFIFVKSKVMPFDGKKQYYATADITGATITTNGETVTYLNRPSRASIQPVVDSVWFARMSNTYKILNCFGESKHLANDSIISSGFAGFTAKKGCFGFVYKTVASQFFNEEKNRYATGATQVSLTNEGLKKIKVLIPTEHIIMQFSKIVEPLMLKEEMLKRSNRLLQETRDRLLPKLMSGEIEV